MNKILLPVTLLALLTASSLAHAGKTDERNAQAQAAQAHMQAQAQRADKRQNQPNMRKALLLLELAHEQLQKAAPNKGGHRIQAMNQIQKAMKQVRKGMRFARNKR